MLEAVSRFAHFTPQPLILSFQGLFASFFPKAFAEAEVDMEAIHKRYKLARNFPNSVYPMLSINFRDAVTEQHVDTHDDPFKPCAVYAEGDYDPTKGGHLILFDLGLVIEFPPGTTILVSSGALAHGNCAIQDGEDRVSFTQYFLGGLSRTVRYGFRTERKLRKKKKEWRELNKANEKRCEEGMGLFSTRKSLAQDIRDVFNL